MTTTDSWRTGRGPWILLSIVGDAARPVMSGDRGTCERVRAALVGEPAVGDGWALVVRANRRRTGAAAAVPAVPSYHARVRA